MRAEMHKEATTRTYDRWSSLYDQTFGLLLVKRLKRAIAQFDLKPGDRVLDLGVGTGILLPHYPRDITVVGADLSQGMLAEAQAKIDRHQLSHCKLVCADATRPPFAPCSFDHIMIAHTISVVSDPVGTLNWVATLLKPGGRVVIVNHFRSENVAVGWFAKVLNPLCVRMGWRSDLSLNDVVGDADLELEYAFRRVPLDLWKIVVLSHGDREDGGNRDDAVKSAGGATAAFG